MSSMITRLLIALLVAIIAGFVIRSVTHSELLGMAFAFLVSFFITKWILERYV